MTLQGITLIGRQTLVALLRFGWKTARCFMAVNLQRKAGRDDGTIHLFPLRNLSHPLQLRSGRSDFFFFGQIFLDQEFAPVRDADIHSVMDLGGNIGLASVWFLNTFPSSRVLTVEANPQNYDMLARNLQPYGERAMVARGGVWWREASLTVVSGQNEGDARVREALPEDGPSATVRGWDIPALMLLGGFTTIDMLKVDIEGAETVIFQRNTDHWLPLVRNLSIETHGRDSQTVVAAALAPYDYTKIVRGELTFYMGIAPRI